MKYCMACEPATELVGRAGEALCPSCGQTEALPPNPVFVVTGASGAGKSTVYPYLRDLLVDCDVFETDQILNYLSSDWDSFRSAWLMVAHGVALNGRSTVLCGSFVPADVEGSPVRQFLGSIHYANLDVPDEVLAARLRARPPWRGWNEERIREHQVFAGHLRRMISPTFSTWDRTPEEVAKALAVWVESAQAGSGAP